MPRYIVTFSGRRKGAIGWPDLWRVEATGDTPDAALLSLYHRFEHIHCPSVRPLPDDAPATEDTHSPMR